MNVGGSLLNPAASINFDAQAIQYDEELEYQKEEQERQNELRDLLTNASFEDLSDEEDDDDDNSSVKSKCSSKDSGAPPDIETVPTWHPPHTSWPMTHLGQTSTPITSNPPLLATPSTIQRLDGQQKIPDYTDTSLQYHSEHGEDSSSQLDNTIKYQPDNNSQVQPAVHPGVNEQNHMVMPPQHDKQVHFHPQEMLPASYNNFIDMNHPQTQQQYAGYMEQPNAFYNYDEVYGPHLPQQDFTTETPHQLYPAYQHHFQQSDGHFMETLPQGHNAVSPDIEHHYDVPTRDRNTVNPAYETRTPNVALHSVQSAQTKFLSIPSKMVSPNSDQPGDDYVVKYSGKQFSGQESNLQNISPSLQIDVRKLNRHKFSDKESASEARDEFPRSTIPEITAADSTVKMQKDFVEQDDCTDMHQLAQLQILYKARGRKIEELSSQIENMKEENEREIRILRHKVIMQKDEVDGAVVSVNQTKILLQDQLEENAKLKGQISALETELQSLAEARDQLVKKLQSSEAAVDLLNQQVLKLGSSDSLSRAREQHESIVSSLTQKYQQENTTLKEKLDVAQSNINEKDANIDALKNQINSLMKGAEDAQIDRANTINRLTSSLEESQKQCRELLESNTLQELSKIKIQAQEALAGRSIAEDLSNALKEENDDLKEAIKMYETASQLHSWDSPNVSFSADNASDSFLHLGIKKKLDWSTATENTETNSVVKEKSNDTFTLKEELQRCLNQYKIKRNQVKQLKDDLKESKDKLASLTYSHEDLLTKFNQNQEELQKLKVTMDEMTVPDGDGIRTLKEVHLHKDVESLTKERDALTQELKNLRQQLTDIAASEQRVTELNAEMTKQMANMVHEFDEDKKIALEKCQKSCSLLHESLKHKLQEQLQEENKQATSKLTSEYEKLIKELRDQLDAVQKELVDTKQIYVNMCQEKDELEAKLRQQYDNRLSEEVKQMKSENEKIKEEEIEQLKLTMTDSAEVQVAQAREKWFKELEAEVKRRVQVQLPLAKVEWFEEHKEAKAKAIADAVSNAKSQWQKQNKQKFDSELEEKIKQAKKSWHCEQRVFTDLEINKKLQLEKDRFIQESLKQHLENAHKKWEQTDLKTRIEEEQVKLQDVFNREKLAAVEKAITEARKDWEQCHSADIEKIKETYERELSLKLKGTWQAAKQEWEKINTLEIENVERLEKQMKDLEDQLEKSELSRDLLLKEKQLCESEWQEKHNNLTCQLEQEKMKAVRPKIHRAQQTVIDSKEVSVDATRECSPEEDWSEERAQLLHEIHVRDELLESADRHLEAEIDKAQEELNSAHEQRMQEQHNRLTAKLQEDFRQATQQNNLQNKMLQKEIISMQGELQQLEQNYSNRIEQLEESNSAKEKEITSLREDLDCKETLLINGNKSVEECEKRLTEKQAELEHLEKRLHTINASLARAEQNQNTAAKSYELQISQLNSQLAHSDAKLKLCHKALRDKQNQSKVSEQQLLDVESRAQRQMHILQQGLESEHKTALENMKGKMVKMRQDFKSQSETMKKRYSSEIYELRHQIKQHSEQQCATIHTPTQTSEDEEDTSSLDVKAHYINAVGKIREKVLQHVSDMKKRSASKIKLAVQKQHNKTMQKTRQYYVRYLQNLLRLDYPSMDKSDLLQLIQDCLIDLPEPELSAPSSQTSFSQVSSFPPSSDNSITSNSDNPPHQPVARNRSMLQSKDLTLDLGENTFSAVGSTERLHLHPYYDERRVSWKGEEDPNASLHVTFAKSHEITNIDSFSMPEEDKESALSSPGNEYQNYAVEMSEECITSNQFQSRLEGKDTSTPLELTPCDSVPQSRTPSAFKTLSKSFRYTSLLKKAKSVSCDNLSQNYKFGGNTDVHALKTKLHKVQDSVAPRKFNPPAEKPDSRTAFKTPSYASANLPHVTLRNKKHNAISQSAFNLHTVGHSGDNQPAGSKDKGYLYHNQNFKIK